MPFVLIISASVVKEVIYVILQFVPVKVSIVPVSQSISVILPVVEFMVMMFPVVMFAVVALIVVGFIVSVFNVVISAIFNVEVPLELIFVAVKVLHILAFTLFTLEQFIALPTWVKIKSLSTFIKVVISLLVNKFVAVV